MNLAAFALLVNAAIWGLSWMPLRWLASQGISVLWSTAIAYFLAFLALAFFKRSGLKALFSNPILWVLGLAYGVTNSSFNWAITLGEVVRVILLFYLMPLWAAIFARLILKERLGPEGLARLAVAVTGAALVLWSPEVGFAFPSRAADWLAVLGGMGFGFANVLLRRIKHIDQAERTLAMFAGSSLLSFFLIATLSLVLSSAAMPEAARIPSAVDTTLAAWAFLIPLSALLALANFSLQYGAARLASQVTALLMMSEIIFASGSAVIWGGETLDIQELLGGALIIAAALWAVFRGAR